MTQRAALRDHPGARPRARTDGPLDTTVEIETPEHVRFRYHLAGPAKRALAYVIDLVVRGAIVFVLGLLAVLCGVGAHTTDWGEELAHASQGFMLLVMFVVEWAYYVLFEVAWSGRTPGKRALSLRVVTEGGHPLRFGNSLLRNLLRAADFLPFLYPVGLVVMARDPRFRRLGDLAGGTLVVTEERSVVAAPLRLDPPPSAAELRVLPQRIPLSGDELDAVELFLRRAGKLSRARELELAEMVVPVFARRMGVRVKDATRFLGVLRYRARELHAPAVPEDAPVRRKKRAA